MFLRILFSSLTTILLLYKTIEINCIELQIDEAGYVAYCPCMGKINSKKNILKNLNIFINVNKFIYRSFW